VIAAGCCGDAQGPTSPVVTDVRFDSLTTVFSDGRYWQAFAVTNVGQATAFQVRAYWHATGQGSESTLAQPPDLRAGERGVVPTMPQGNPAWTYPFAPDSIRWTAM
jgi:hypothetical protein